VVKCVALGPVSVTWQSMYNVFYRLLVGKDVCARTVLRSGGSR